MSRISADFAIMIAWNGKDRSGVFFIGMIELVVIFRVLALEVNHVTKMVKKGRLFRQTACLHLPSHVQRDTFLRASSADASRVPNRMEDNLAGVLNNLSASRQHLIEVHVKRKRLIPYRRR